MYGPRQQSEQRGRVVGIEKPVAEPPRPEAAEAVAADSGVCTGMRTLHVCEHAYRHA